MVDEFVVALDLEGTLITDAEDRIPRPGLFEFLEACRQLGRVVIYTMVDEAGFRAAARDLVENGYAPEWFAEIDHYHCGRDQYKDLNRISGASTKTAVLVDDISGFVAPGQEHRWIPIPFVDSSVTDDNEFDLALWRVKRVYSKTTGEIVDLTWPGDKDQLIEALQDEIDELLQDVVRLQLEKETRIT